MKVVLFCGGFGTRLREYSDTIPKSMVSIGPRPIIWHLMKYYAHYGHTEFILCLGYRGDLIKEYFLNYDECVSNDFTLSDGGKTVHVHHRDIDDWKITFAETGLHSNLGQRLLAAEKYVGTDDVFLANYSDGLTDLSLPAYLEHFRSHDKVASFLCVRPAHSFHVVSLGNGGDVLDLRDATESDLWINGGFFAFKHRIFEYIKDGEELVCEPFQRLIRDNELVAYQYTGFWACMDTFKDKQRFEDMTSRGDTPWQVWKSGATNTAAYGGLRAVPSHELRVPRGGRGA
ncbi:MAG: glucose-1-phosphate cytidylyltransferase [Acidobacteria bacterium]|nr:MAG: glucose-1-phosphate cytidylyltransferase [Candidatus Rokubacteria bacterium 13_1_40CM_4_67_11]PYQ01271.1 MAG: glucose-1-phosphate cytidylyltransferase [Acidobacteriota bacterium]